MNKLIKNIDKIHTTKMGVERIRQNLSLSTEDVVEWCKTTVKNANIIIGQGKNWYVYGDGNVTTINSKSDTIITAHKIKPKIRTMTACHYTCLNEFLYQSIFVPEGQELPPRDLIFDEEIYIYIKDFGKQHGDLGVVAEVNGQIVGAVWTRIIPAYGHLDNRTPTLAIALFSEFRGLGIGTKLMKKLFILLKENGYQQTSLSVQKNNPAVRFYKRLGYRITAEKLDHIGQEDYLMLKVLN